MAFQIKVLLPTNFKVAREGVRGPRQGSARITAIDKNRWQHIALLLQRALDGKHRWQGFDMEFDFARGVAGLHHGIRYDQANHLANVLNRVDGEDGFIPNERRQHRPARDVAGQHHTAHTGHQQCGAGVNTQQLAVCHVGQDGCAVQSASHFGNVVNVGGRTGHLGSGAFVDFGGSRGAHGTAPAVARFSTSAKPATSKCSRFMFFSP